MLSMGKMKKVELGTYTPTEDEFSSRVHIAHGLGATPDFVIAIADEIVASTDMTTRYLSVGYCGISNLVASNKNASGFAAYQGNYQGRDAPFQATENINYEKFLHVDTFEIPYYSSSDTLKAGVTYHYVVGILE